MSDSPEIPEKSDNAQSASAKISMVAVVLSVAALMTSIIEVNFVRQELRSEAWPYLSLHRSYTAEGYKLKLENKGVGAARLREIKLFYNDQVVTDLDQTIIDIVGEENAFSYDVYGANNPAPGVISSGEVVHLFSVPWEPRTRLLVSRMEGKTSVTACYCSIYDDCWLATLDKGDPEEVDACPN